MSWGIYPMDYYQDGYSCWRKRKKDKKKNKLTKQHKKQKANKGE